MSPKLHNITHHAELDMWVHAYYINYVETLLSLFRTSIMIIMHLTKMKRFVVFSDVMDWL